LGHRNPKTSYQELWRLKQAGKLNQESQKLFLPKVREELYDLENDPYETENLIQSPSHQDIVSEMSRVLRNWIIKTRDTGFLIEAEMMERAAGSSPYDLAQDKQKYQLKRILSAAERVGNPEIKIDQLLEDLCDPDSAVRFWTIVTLIAIGPPAKVAIPILRERLTDTSSAVQITAAEALCSLEKNAEGLAVLAKYLQYEDKPWLMLWAAIAIRNLGKDVLPLIPQIKATLNRISGEVWGRYRDWLYTMFTGMALDQALLNCGFKVEPYK
jgi:N-sulfoglucosamine sulfohydrolase